MDACGDNHIIVPSSQNTLYTNLPVFHGLLLVAGRARGSKVSPQVGAYPVSFPPLRPGDNGYTLEEGEGKASEQGDKAVFDIFHLCQTPMLNYYPLSEGYNVGIRKRRARQSCS